MEETIQEILNKYWGYDAFRSMQQEIILSVLEGKDTLALLPTGGGKSICFQVPALANKGICLVISPLIALMKDQVQNLKKKGIPALSVYSGMSFWEVKKTLQNAAHGNYKFLYVSPERLESSLFLEYLPGLLINLIAVDEAHCVSQWGYDFRPPYLRIAALRESLPDIPILALTASATKDVQDDICDKLSFKKDQQRFQKSFERPNLSYSVFNVAAKQTRLLEICNSVKGTGIVYCKSRKRTKEVSELLAAHGIIADYYHAGLANAVRTGKQESWIKNEIRIIVCTNAFGMGIDKSDVRFVVHYDVPDALENYYQEAGRAGRDEKRAYAVLLYHEGELHELEQQSSIRYPPMEEVKKVYKALANYLQLPSGTGEGVYFDFDINDFVKKFKLNIQTVNYSLKILEQEDLISYNEQFFMPSSLIFTTNKDDLNQFENAHPEFDALIKGLLRSYEGIFDYPVNISESRFADFIHSNVNELVNNLKTLQGFGIIDYMPQKDKPQIIFLHNRFNTQDIWINDNSVSKRKHAFEKRVKTIITYVKKTMVCRSKIIGNYFNDTTIKSCGICDNCINKKNLIVSKIEFDRISLEIFKLIDGRPVTAKDVLSKLESFKKNKIWEVLNYLQSEDKIGVLNDGKIVRKKGM
ncbi:MAG: ATP-dependent DNA helicase RecQ [Ginsengibacter sp.]